MWNISKNIKIESLPMEARQKFPGARAEGRRTMLLCRLAQGLKLAEHTRWYEYDVTGT